ncbi:MAG: amidase [Betaproteobacteria bacterium]|nr:amidase [Betaproteobacteria bacterium]
MLNFLSAAELSVKLQSRAVSAREVLDAHLVQIERVNSKVNAIVTLDGEGAYRQANAIDARRMKGEALSPLAGLPIACKDMERVKGMRTTFGSPIYKDHVADIDTLMVERFRRHGMVIIGKTNTPEFALGSQTFNTVFGKTLNPWDVTKTCGGSSGGAAVAVATRMLPFADGSDLGASLRNPANFCNVVGVRPTPGRVPVWPAIDLWNNTAVHGAIGRTAHDAAYLLYAQAGGDRRVPNAIWEDPAQFLKPLARDFKGVRVAYSPTLGGLPVERAVGEAVAAGIRHFEALGCIVEEAEPDLAEADGCFDVLRGVLMAQLYGPLLDKYRGQMKDTAVWNIERGLALTSAQIVEATRQHSRVFETMRAFMERYEFLLAPVNQVLPFPVDQPYVTEINGIKLDNYLDWMKSCFRITMTAHPALSAPIGFAAGGLPVGVQIVGRYRDELGILQLAHTLEQQHPLWKNVPPVCEPD